MPFEERLPSLLTLLEEFVLLCLHLDKLLLLNVGHDLRDQRHLEELLISIFPASLRADRGATRLMRAGVICRSKALLANANSAVAILASVAMLATLGFFLGSIYCLFKLAFDQLVTIGVVP